MLLQDIQGASLIMWPLKKKENHKIESHWRVRLSITLCKELYLGSGWKSGACSCFKHSLCLITWSLLCPVVILQPITVIINHTHLGAEELSHSVYICVLSSFKKCSVFESALTLLLTKCVSCTFPVIFLFAYLQHTNLVHHHKAVPWACAFQKKISNRSPDLEKNANCDCLSVYNFFMHSSCRW